MHAAQTQVVVRENTCAHLCLYDEWQQVCVVVGVHDGVKAALQDVHGRTHAVLHTTCASQQQQQQQQQQQGMARTVLFSKPANNSMPVPADMSITALLHRHAAQPHMQAVPALLKKAYSPALCLKPRSTCQLCAPVAPSGISAARTRAPSWALMTLHSLLQNQSPSGICGRTLGWQNMTQTTLRHRCGAMILHRSPQLLEAACLRSRVLLPLQLPAAQL
jgi:hypothetical protein